GAAILLADGSGVAQGSLEIEALQGAWPRGADAERLPAYPFLALAVRDAGLRRTLVEADVVAVVPIVSPHCRWGDLLLSAGLLAWTMREEHREPVEAFVGQIVNPKNDCRLGGFFSIGEI
ncbi:MAG: hypothetical protein ACE5G1_14715, partial [bacterium]